jgi:hypothetical protein
MSHDEPESPDPGLNALESALGSLVPARSRIDRDVIMFGAGEASAMTRRHRGGRSWRAAAAGLALVALGEGALLARRPPERVVEELVVVHVPAPAAVPAVPAAEEPAPRPAGSLPALGHTAYERLTAQVLRCGLDGLPASPSARASDPAPSPASSGSLLNEELRRIHIHDPGDPS